jgi:hypothetical protein
MIKTTIEWVLSKLFPVDRIILVTPPADKFIPSEVLIRIMRDTEDYKNVTEICQ